MILILPEQEEEEEEEEEGKGTKPTLKLHDLIKMRSFNQVRLY